MSDTHPALEPIGSKLLLFVVVLGLLVAATQLVGAQTYTVLYNFCSQPKCADGYEPTGSLVMDKKGNLYGTTVFGGTGSACGSNGCGTVFKLTPAGVETVLHDFAGFPDGEYPSGLVLDKKGNLYGTTQGGGPNGWGAVYGLTSSGTETVLYSFSGGVDAGTGTDGAFPNGPLVRDTKGNLYGSTSEGGAYYCPEAGCGTVFKVSPTGVETQLYAFTGGADDGNPFGGLVRDAQGNLYGATAQGTDFGPIGGTVFKLTPAGNETQLYSFTGGKDGNGPYGGLVTDAKGNFYGTTFYGGNQSCNDGEQSCCGVVFKVTPSGKERALHRFTGRQDGGYPTTGVILDAGDNLYGTTVYGGSIVYEIPKKGKEIVLHTFTGGSDGTAPHGGLLMDAKGNLYGTTTAGGANGYGVVFELTP
jgi:uncharacterized repeat protein (TIGR03803 family)